VKIQRNLLNRARRRQSTPPETPRALGRVRLLGSVLLAYGVHSQPDAGAFRGASGKLPGVFGVGRRLGDGWIDVWAGYVATSPTPDSRRRKFRERFGRRAACGLRKAQPGENAFIFPPARLGRPDARRGLHALHNPTAQPAVTEGPLPMIRLARAAAMELAMV